MSVKVESERGKAKVQQSLEALQNYQDELVVLAYKTQQTLAERTPVKTGETQKSWTVDVQSTQDKVSWYVTPKGREQIVEYLEFGTKPHVIYPTEKKALHFFTEEGEERFAAYVFHPGTKALGFVRQTKDDLKKWADEAYARYAAKIRSIWR